MKKLSTFFMGGVFLFAMVPAAYAQTVYSVGHAQPNELLATASGDVTFCNGSNAVLSGTATEGTPTYSYAWTPSTGLSSTTNDTTTASSTSNQTYTFTVTDSRNCTASDAVSVSVIDCSGLENIKEIESLNLYPNPTEGDFSIAIQFKSKPSAVKVEIFNMNGQVFISKNYEKPGTELKENFNLNEVAGGNYMLRITIGKNSLTKTFVVK